MQRCRSCGKAIVWARTKKGKAMPLEDSDRGNIRIVDGQVRFVQAGEGSHVAHFTSCPQAAQHRKAKETR